MNRIEVRRARPGTAYGPPVEQTRQQRTSSTLVRLAARLLPLLVAFTLLCAASASAISRDGALARGQKWVDSPVKYSQSRHHLGYRTDCSGYVSMCWKTGTSWSTRSFYHVSHRIPTSALKPGDALLKKGYHIRMFYGWTDDSHTEYVAYESGSGLVAVCRLHSIAEDLAFGYVPTRYDRISESPRPRNILQNGSFNVWARSWGSQPETPVWWQTNGAWWQTVATHRKDVYRSTHSSLKLANASHDPGTYTELTQSVPVTAGAYYRLSAWAKSTFDPRALELRLTYINAAGDSVAETSTDGQRAGIVSTSFGKMTVLLASPPDAVKALVSVRLAGGTSTNTSGTIIPGTWVTLDDISLERPQLVVGIKTSATTAYTGRTVTLSGAVAPTRAIGAPAVIYVAKPGSSWKPLSTSAVFETSGGAAMWRGRFTFTRSMPRGTYRFKTTVSGIPGYLGATSSVASVKLK